MSDLRKVMEFLENADAKGIFVDVSDLEERFKSISRRDLAFGYYLYNGFSTDEANEYLSQENADRLYPRNAADCALIVALNNGWSVDDIEQAAPSNKNLIPARKAANTSAQPKNNHPKRPAFWTRQRLESFANEDTVDGKTYTQLADDELNKIKTPDELKLFYDEHGELLAKIRARTRKEFCKVILSFFEFCLAMPEVLDTVTVTEAEKDRICKLCASYITDKEKEFRMRTLITNLDVFLAGVSLAKDCDVESFYKTTTGQFKSVLEDNRDIQRGQFLLVLGYVQYLMKQSVKNMEAQLKKANFTILKTQAAGDELTPELNSYKQLIDFLGGMKDVDGINQLLNVCGWAMLDEKQVFDSFIMEFISKPEKPLFDIEKMEVVRNQFHPKHWTLSRNATLAEFIWG